MFFGVKITEECNGNNIQYNKRFLNSKKKTMKRTFLKFYFLVIV